MFLFDMDNVNKIYFGYLESGLCARVYRSCTKAPWRMCRQIVKNDSPYAERLKLSLEWPTSFRLGSFFFIRLARLNVAKHDYKAKFYKPWYDIMGKSTRYYQYKISRIKR